MFKFILGIKIKGTRITSYVDWANDVCPKIKAYPEGIVSICAVANQFFGTELAKTKKPLIDECDAGFVKFAVPIVVNGDFLDTIGGCGHLLNDGEVGTFLIEKAIGKGDLGLDKKINSVKTISDTEVNELVVYVQDYLDGALSGQPSEIFDQGGKSLKDTDSLICLKRQK